MAKKRKQTELKRAIQKERKRIRRLERYYQKQGYYTYDLNLPTAHSLKTLNILKSIDSKYLLARSEAVSEKSGKLISGLERQKEIRSEASRKAYITRQAKSQPKKEILYKSALQYPPIDTLIYDNVMDLLKYYSNHGAQIIEDELNKQIVQYGKGKVIQALNNLDADEITTLQNVIHYEKEPAELHREIRRFFDAIRGELPKIDENKELENMLEGFDLI